MRKGQRKEYKIVKQFRDDGFDIVQRTAGSHSPIDVIAIDKRVKRIFLIQCKSDSEPESKIKRLKEEFDWLNDEYLCCYMVI